MARAPAPASGVPDPTTSHPATAHAAMGVALAAAGEPDPAAAVVLPASGFPVGTGRAGPADLDARRRWPDPDHDFCRRDRDVRCGDSDSGRLGADHASGRQSGQGHAEHERDWPETFGSTHVHFENLLVAYGDGKIEVSMHVHFGTPCFFSGQDRPTWSRQRLFDGPVCGLGLSVSKSAVGYLRQRQRPGAQCQPRPLRTQWPRTQMQVARR